MTYKIVFCTIAGIVGGIFLQVFGSWSIALTVLCICMAIDYVTGLVVAGVFLASPKSQTGGLNSAAGWKGLLRKVATLVIVLMARFLDVLLGTEYIRDAVVLAFAVNEIISIVENCGLMGLYIPPVILRAIDVLRQRVDPPDEEDKVEEADDASD